MTTTNSTTTNSFTGRVRDQLTNVRVSVERTLADIQTASSKGAADLRAKRADAQSGMEARHRDIESANAKMKAGLEAKKAGTDAAIADWKTRLDVRMLEHRADDAEDYATATTMFAWGAVEEANAAVLDAIVARADADEAREKATAPAQS